MPFAPCVGFVTCLTYVGQTFRSAGSARPEGLAYVGKDDIRPWRPKERQVPFSIERRRSPRVPVTNRSGLPTSVRDVSLGGLSIELPHPVPVGSVRDFALTLAGAEIVLRTRVAHVHRESKPNGRTVFVVGVAFLADVSDQTSLQPLRLAS